MPIPRCFSALQRAENSSIDDDVLALLNSEEVSVLFSEPKIPQSPTDYDARRAVAGFSALQRAENSSILGKWRWNYKRWSVSVLFSEPKIPQSKGKR